MSLFIEPGSASLRGDRLVSIQGRQQSDLCGIHVVSLPQEFRVPRDVAVVATIEGKLGWMEICHRKMVSNAAHKKSRNSIQSCSFQRGAARIRTGDGGFAIHFLSHLATAPFRLLCSGRQSFGRQQCRIDRMIAGTYSAISPPDQQSNYCQNFLIGGIKRAC
jgi:hypothetical protein